MKSVKCPECGFVGWADAERCKKCGVQRMPDPSGDAYESPSNYDYYQPRDRYYSSGKLKKGLAITSLVIGIVDMFTLGMLGVGAIVGIILSIVALMKAKRNPLHYGGQGMATAGLVMSILSVVIIFPVGIVASIAIPNLLASRRAANEGAAMSTLRTINSAETTYQATYGAGQFGTLEQLIEKGLLKPEVGRARYGYKFTATVKDSDYNEGYPGFEAVAVPEKYRSSGIRSFYIDETGVLRAADNHGAVATALDDPLDGDSYSYDSPPRRRESRPTY